MPTTRRRTADRTSEETWAELEQVARAASRRSAAIARRGTDAAAEGGAGSTAGGPSTPPPARGPRGAALLCRDGSVFAGAELGGGDGVALSAERLAVYDAHLAGKAKFRVLLLRGGARGGQDAGPPTSATLQVLFEFAPDLVVHWGTKTNPQGGRTVRELLPGAFGSGHLAGHREA
ncbi:MAG: hypothetical protein R3E97_20500 [Candidatus Eisenbacteria bacterium]